MSGLDHIAVRVEHTPTGNARAILNQVAALLADLAAGGSGGSIDLSRGAPLSAADRDLLDRVLGHGEVSAQVDSLGPTRIHESAIPGVWRTTHMNSDEQVLAELIEVTRCPELLMTPAEDLPEATARLHARLTESECDETTGDDHGD